MSVFIRHKKEKNFTIIDNSVFMDHSLSMKAKGLLTQIYSLPENWDYSVKGLSTLFSDGRDAVNSALQELIDHGYIVRTQKVDDLGRFDGYEYDIYETPQTKYAENPIAENPSSEYSLSENPTQLNTKEENTKEENTKEGLYIVDKPQKTTRFTPPTVEEVSDYCRERNNLVDPEKFVDYYTARGWKIGKNSMKDWKAAVRTWERNNYSEKSRPAPVYTNPFTELKRQEGMI